VISSVGRDSPISELQDTIWVVRAGLADRAGVSLESKNYPGCYLRHRQGAVYQEPYDGSDQFAQDATYAVTTGRNGHGVSLASWNYPSRFVRHYLGAVFIAACGGPEDWDAPQWWADDVSWLVKSSWTR